MDQRLSIIKKQRDNLERPPQPILLESFNGNMEQAVTFYCAEVDRLYLANYLLNAQLKSTLEQKKQLGDKIFQIERNQKNTSQEEKKKRHRRCANQIERQFECPAPRCGKSYGSEGSLSQHLKLKHPQLVDENEQKSEVKNLKE